MDPRERINDPEEEKRILMDAISASLWCALPCIVSSWDADLNTVQATPTVQLSKFDEKGAVVQVELPVLQDVPVVFPRGGSCAMTFPLQAGDEVLVVFADRCIDAWWQSGGIQRAATFRTHDLSDGFAIPGPMSKPRRLGAISTEALQIRSDDGDTVIELNPATRAISLTAPGGLTIAADTTFVGSVTANGHRIDETHHHVPDSHGDTQGPVA